MLVQKNQEQINKKKKLKNNKIKKFLSLSKNFSPDTERMDFTDFVEPWSFEFIPFHIFSIFVLAKIFHHTRKRWFLHISHRHEASVKWFLFNLEYDRNFF